MQERLTINWEMLAVRGVCAIIFGILAWIWPGLTVFALIVLFGVYALVDGIAAIVAAIRGVPGRSRAGLAITGVLGVLLGIAALVSPGVTSLVLLMLIAAWAVVTGVFEIVAAVSLRREISGEGWHIASGVISVLFGVALFTWPATGALTLVWLIGIFSVVFGIVSLVAAFQLRRLGHGGGRHSVQSGTPGATGTAAV